MIKALIIEDVKKTAELLKEMLVSLFNDIEIIGPANNVKDGIELIHKQKPDIVFLDINLNQEIGFDVLKQTNPENYEVVVTTAHSEHAIQAIKKAAIDFLLKPYDFEELKNAVEKARKTIELKKQLKQKSSINAQTVKLSVPTTEGLIFIETENIVYIKADEGYSDIIINDKSKIVTSKRLTYYEKILENQQFFRVHKSYMINLKHIKKYHKGRSGSIIMIDNSIIPVAENKKKALMNLLMV